MSTTGLVAGRALARLKTFHKVSVSAMINHGLATQTRHRGSRGDVAGSIFTGRLVAGPPGWRPPSLAGAPTPSSAVQACAGDGPGAAFCALVLPAPGWPTSLGPSRDAVWCPLAFLSWIAPRPSSAGQPGLV